MVQRVDQPAETIREAVAAFDDPQTLQAAVSDLQSHGFDRADISVIAPEDLAGHVAGRAGDVRKAEDDPGVERSAVVGDTDVRQARVLGTSLASVLAAFAAAGLTVATGGAAAVAAGAAAVAAGGVGAAGTMLGRIAGDSERNFLQEQIERGGVLLWVRVRDAAAEPRALDILRRHSAHDVHVHEIPATASAYRPGRPRGG
jgi:hypothetical protein